MSLLEWGVLLPWLVVALGSGLGYLLVRQSGRIAQRLEGLEMDIDTFQDELEEMVLEAADQGLVVGVEAPPFELPDLAGGRASLSDFRGRLALLVLFSPECSYCKQMAPELAALPPDGGPGRPVPVIVTAGDPEINRRFMEEHGVRCRVLLDEGREVAKLYHSDGTPEAYLVDEEGRIAAPRGDGIPGVLGLVLGLAAGDDDVWGGVEGAPVSEKGPVSASSRSSAPRAAAGPPAEAEQAGHTLRIPIRGIPEQGIGVGDLVKRVTDLVGLKPCRGCERRREILNRWVIKGSGRASGERKP